jgi:hypothetical protein
MSEPTPVIQLGTYTFDKFNVLDQNMYSNSAENISAFSNGMAAVDDLNKKTNPVVHKIKKAQVGETITINININIIVNFDRSKINFIDDLNAVPLVLTRLVPTTIGDDTINFAVHIPNKPDISGTTTRIGTAVWEDETGTFSLNVANMQFPYRNIGSDEEKKICISYNVVATRTSSGFKGTAYLKGTTESDKKIIADNASYVIDAGLFSCTASITDISIPPL